MNHLQAQMVCLEWLLGRRWASVGGIEISYAAGRLDVAAAGGTNEYALWKAEWFRELAVARQECRRPTRGAPSPGQASPDVGLIEVKATRGDLLADLRRRKMHRYTALAGWAWLAVTPEALLLDGSASLASMKESLQKLDVPARWGALVVHPDGPVSLKKATRLRAVEASEAAAWVQRIGRSTAWRLVHTAE